MMRAATVRGRALKNMLEDDFLTIAEVATLCRVTPESVRAWVHTRALRAFTTPGGKLLRVRRADVDAVVKPIVRDPIGAR